VHTENKIITLLLLITIKQKIFIYTYEILSTFDIQRLKLSTYLFLLVINDIQ